MMPGNLPLAALFGSQGPWRACHEALSAAAVIAAAHADEIALAAFWLVFAPAALALVIIAEARA
ncbi:MAG: hypothetical protein ACE15C_14575 [Phycisphaerae bacterium]